MKAMILAAGLGTRLMPLTHDRPKALVEIAGKTLLEHTIRKFVQSGFTDIVVNVHHFAQQVIAFLGSRDFGARIHISDESARLLDTGGGILHAAHFLSGNDPFLVHNVDVITDIDLNKLYAEHIMSASLSTLVVSKRDSSRVFLLDNDLRLMGWRNMITGRVIIPGKSSKELTAFAFAGIHVISPAFFSLLKTSQPFSVIDAYLRLCENHLIRGIDFSGNFILDVGKPESLIEAEAVLKESGA